MEKVDLDTILSSVGNWGQFQIRSYVPLCCVVIFSVFQMSYIFVARDTKYRCKIQSCQNESEVYNPRWLANAVPYKDNVPNRCLYYEPVDNHTCTDFNKNITKICEKYVFEKNQTTIVQDFNITCDDNLWKLTLVGTISVVGELFCLPFAGFISDRFGRKRMLILSMLFSTIIGILRSFSPWYLLYIILEFLDTALGSGTYSGAFILALELVDTKRRTSINTIICLAFAVGQVFLGIAAWGSSSWRIMLRILYIPGILITLSLWYVPESIRWLISKNQTKKALKILNSAKMDDARELTLEDLQPSQLTPLTCKSEKPSEPFKEILKSKTLIFRIIHCCFTWVCCNFPYYGLTIQSVALSEDVYLNFICSALVEVPAYFILQFFMDRIGRRRTLAFSLILGGVSCVAVYKVAQPKWLALIIFMIGKFFVTVAYTTLYIYTAEMFPTSSRHSVLAVCSMSGRIGSMLAPQVPLLERVFKSLPLIIFAAMSITSGILAFYFPETLDTELPDEVNEAVKIEEKGS